MRTAADRSPRRRRWGFLWVSVALVTLAWGLRLYRLDAQSFWYDEGYCAFLAALKPLEVIRWTAREFTPPLYHLTLALWLPAAGATEFAERFLSVWAGTLLAVGMIRLGRILHSRTAGLMAGLLATFSPFYVWYSQEVRMYALQALLGMLATLSLLKALRRPGRWRSWIALALLDGLTLYAQTTGGFLLVFHGLIILAWAVSQREMSGWRILWRGGLALGGATLAWLPWLIYAFPYLSENAGYWGGVLHWQQVFEGAFRGFVTGGMMDGALAIWALRIWGGACLVGVIALLTASGPEGWKRLLFLLTYFLTPALTMAALFRGVPKFSPRYLIVAAPPVFLLPAVGAAALWQRSDLRRAAGGLLLAALLVTAGVGLSNLYFDPTYARTDFRAAARLVREKMAPDELVLIVPGHTFPVWQFYFGSEGWRALPDDPILDVRHVLHYADVVEALNRWLADWGGVWLVGWDPRVVDPTDVVGYTLGRVGEKRLDVYLTGDLRLRHYRFDDFRPLPLEPDVTPASRDTVRDLPLALLGCTWPDPLPGDRVLQATCFWEQEATFHTPPASSGQDALPLHLNVSARLYDEAGVEWGRADTAISGPDLVAGRWPVGKAVLGRYQLAPFPGVPPGDFYRLELWVYEPDGAVYGAASVRPVTIAPPRRPFSASLAIPAGRAVDARLGGLTLEMVDVRPTRASPGETVRVEAIWRVDGPFESPRLAWAGEGASTRPHVWLLPRPGAAEEWKPGDRYRTITPAPISKHAMGGETDLLVVSGADAMRIGTVMIDVVRVFTVPAGVRPMAYRLGEAISLAGVDLTERPAVDGASSAIDLTLYWRAEEEIERSYTVFVHLAGPDGVVIAQVDAPPQGGNHPTDHWLPGEVVTDAYHLALPSSATAYRVLVGMYDPATLTRLPVTNVAGSISVDLPADVIEIDVATGQ